ncbi:MAG: methyl-accepting chemotaxis protein [Candidatus Sulfobium sp.]
MNLQKKATFVVAVVLFVILGINTAVLTYIASNKYRQAILAKTQAVGEGLQRDLGKVLSLGVPVDSLEGVNDKLKELITNDKAIAYALVTDAEGRILFDNEEGNVGKTLKDKASLNAVSRKQELVQTTGAFYDLSFPLLSPEGKIVGALRLGVKLKTIHEQLYELLKWALGISGFCFLLSVGLVYGSISRFITRPILAMEKVADRIADGDLTHVIGIKGNDEVASLGKAINRMAFNLKDMIGKIRNITDSVSGVTSNIASSSQGVLSVVDVQKSAIEETSSAIEDMDSSISSVAKGAENLSQSAADTSSSILQMTASIERIAENADIFNETAHDTASSVEEMISTVKQIAESLDTLSASSEAIATSIEEVNATTRDIEHRAGESVGLAEAVMTNASEKGMNASSAAIEGMENIRENVTALSDIINLLGKKTEDIGKILTVIDTVADQTNLLALNAAILASKAGEHGKGFTIVADEIKSLAEKTSVSTNEIEALITSVRNVTRSSIDKVSEGIGTVEKGLKLVQDVNDALRDIVESSRASTDMARAIQRATAEEAFVIKQITDSVERMTEQTERISLAIAEQNKGGKFITEATEKVKELSSQVRTATNEQKGGSRQMAAVTENVTQQAGQIAEATGRQKQKSIEIVKSMEKIRSTTDNLIGSSNDMNAVITSLKEEALNLLTELQKFQV